MEEGYGIIQAMKDLMISKTRHDRMLVSNIQLAQIQTHLRSEEHAPYIHHSAIPIL